MIDPAILESFERGFSTNSGGCRRTCECGKEFYNPEGGWDWNDGELEALHDDPNATSLDYTVGEVHFEGRTYVNACACWHDRAEKIIQWINSHAYSIAEFLNLEKQRKQHEADNAPGVR